MAAAALQSSPPAAAGEPAVAGAAGGEGNISRLIILCCRILVLILVPGSDFPVFEQADACGGSGGPFSRSAPLAAGTAGWPAVAGPAGGRAPDHQAKHPGAPPGQGPAATPAPGVHLLVCCEGFQLGMFCVFVLWEVPGMWSPRHVRTQVYWRVASGNNQIIRLWVRVAILCF